MTKRVKFLLYVALGSLVVSCPLFWIFEAGTNESVNNGFDVFWWWVVTSATVGYGDIVPITWPGRTLCMLTICVGFFIYANFVAIIAESVHAFLDRRRRGSVQVKVRDHIVLCEYTAIADELIQAIPGCPELAPHPVVIVTGLVSMNPYPQHHFVSGVPINPAALRLANIEHAKYVFIFANLRFADPDVKTMHIASRVVMLNPKATVFVELIEPDNDLLEYAPDCVVPLSSRELIMSVLRDKKLDPSEWMARAQTQRSRAVVDTYAG